VRLHIVTLSRLLISKKRIEDEIPTYCVTLFPLICYRTLFMTGLRNPVFGRRKTG
jgi:hypothetical protein